MSIKNIIFIDSQVSDHEVLMAGFRSMPQTECYVLRAGQDGVLQMEQLLAEFTNLDSIQIISHGAPGVLQLGDILLNNQRLSYYQNQLQAIGSSLNPNGDILLYGCNVAQGHIGLGFVNALAQLTGADIAASDDLTGPEINVLLEVATGSVEADQLILAELTASLAAPTGSVIITGTAKQGEVLMASHNLEDADGLGSISYQWFADGSLISGATAATFLLGQDQVGKAISVTASYTDLLGSAESKTSVATSLVQGLTAVDAIPPVLVSTSPTDGQVRVGVASTIQLIFSEPIQKGSGNIYLVLEDGSEAVALNVLASNVVVQGDKLVVKPSVPLLQGKTYTVVMAAGVVKDLSGNPYAGISDYNFTTEDRTPPGISTYSPVDGAIGVLLDENLSFTFSESVQKGAGAIELRKDAPNGALVESFQVSSSTRLLWSEDGTQLIIDPSNNLLEGAKYFVVFPAGSFKDVAGNLNLAINAYDFSAMDITPPVVVEKSPAPGAVRVPIFNNIAWTFNEAIKKGVGVIELRMEGVDAPIETFDVATSNRLRFNGKQLVIDPTDNFLQGKKYSLLIADGAIQDLSGNAYVASDYDINYQFTALDTVPPTVTAFSPSDGATAIPVNASIYLMFSEPVQFGAGGIQLRAQSATGPVVESFNMGLGGNAVLGENNTLTLDPRFSLSPDTNYFLTISNGAVKDMSGNPYAGVTTYDFTTAPDTVGPVVQSFNPRDGATGVPLDSGIEINFNERVLAGTGSIEIRSGSRLGPVVESFDVTNSPHLQFVNNMLTILPQQELEPQTRYFVVLPRGTVKDSTGNLYLGTSTYDFVTADTVAPTVSSFTPSHEATGVALNRPIEVTFSELVKMGSGNIELRLGTSPTGSLVESVAITDSSVVSIVDNVLKIQWKSPLALDMNYFVRIPAETIQDMSGNSFQGLSYYFRTTNNPLGVFFNTPGNDVWDGSSAIETAVYAAPYHFFEVMRIGGSNNWYVYGDGDDLLKNVDRIQFTNKKIALDVNPGQHTGQALDFWSIMNPAFVHTPSWLGTVVGLFDAGYSMPAVFNWAIHTVNGLIGPVTDDVLVDWVGRNISQFSLWVEQQSEGEQGAQPFWEQWSVIETPAWYALVDSLYSDDDSTSVQSQIDFLTGLADLDIINPVVEQILLTGVEYV